MSHLQLSANPIINRPSEPYELRDGVFRPVAEVQHRDEEYDSCGFELLRRMQTDHFWYRGRHRFLLCGLHRQLCRLGRDFKSLRLVDLGGGCGGWINYLLKHQAETPEELALADSSLSALRLAREVLPESIPVYQVDLLRLEWNQRWDIAFLLDVLEHIPDDRAALREIGEALAPGGLLFVTTPALKSFWTWNDDVAKHQRRYCKADFRALAVSCGLDLLDVRYFMFFLSPLLLAQRMLTRPPAAAESLEELYELMQSTHRVPPAIINAMLAAVFACETPLGHRIPFPWGTSVLAIFRRP
jgi:SAM-dependent methyltransferase